MIDIRYMCDPRKILAINNERSFHSFPISVEIQPTNLCNLNCSYCSYKLKKINNEFIPKEIFFNLIDDLIKMKVKSVYFSGGGEPTLYTYLEEGMKVLYQHDIKIALLTNGTQNEMLKKVSKYCEYILVNVETEGSSSRERKEVYRIAKRIKEDNSLNSVIIGARLIITKKNCLNFNTIVNELLAYDFDYIQCTPAVNYIDLDEEYVSDIELESLKIDKVFFNPKVMIAEKNSMKIERPNDCKSIKMGLHATVMADGVVSICPPLSGNGEIGNINKDRLIDIWKNDKHKQKVEYINKNYRTMDCRYCRFLSYNKVMIEMEKIHNNPHVYFI